MAPKNKSKKGGNGAANNQNKPKSKKQADEDEFEKLLATLSKATKQVGAEREKELQKEEELRKQREATHKAIEEKRNTNEFEQALLRRQQQMQFQQLLQQLMMAQRPFLEKPNTEFKSETSTSNAHFNAAVGEMQGWRTQMEDAHIVDPTFPTGAADSKEGLFAVFDGHSGKGCALECRASFPQVLKKHMKAEGDSHVVDFDAAFMDMDVHLRAALKEESGCTAVMVHVTESKVTCASVGDSRAVLCRNGAAFDLSHDHKPELAAEEERIVAGGGFVQDNRVNGQLAMSRAMGDFNYKPADKEAREQLVIAVPDVVVVDRESGDAYVAVACDGIFDVLSNDELIAFIEEKKKAGLSNEKICEEVCNRCLAPMDESGTQPARAEGTDNMTIMIVDLK